MEVTIKDRLYIPAFFPKEGNYKDFNLKKEIRQKIEITEAERLEINLRENKENGRIEWDVEKEKPLLVEFSADEVAYLKRACEQISDEQLPDDMWATVERVFDSIQQQA